MFSTISGRLTTILVGFVLLLGTVSVASHFVLKRQADDALIVNLAGRQRMLTQKLTKEVSELVNLGREGTPQQVSSQRDKVQATARVFEMTLYALKDGGTAPVNLEMTKMRPTPAASPEVAKQLATVTASWETFKKQISAVLESNGTDMVAARAVTEANMPLMNQMNAAVDMMQAESEGKLQLLFFVQWGALLLGSVLVGFGTWLARTTIAQPLVELAAAARSMSTGNLNVDLQLDGTRELQDLGASFDRMRASLLASLNGIEGASADDDV